MSKASLIGSCELTINSALKRISKLEGKNKKALESEFKEWINAIENCNQKYDVLYINKIVSDQARGCRSGYGVLWSLILDGFSLSELLAALKKTIKGINTAKK